MIEVDVEDEGIGIAPGDHERIFERFVQGETGDRRRFGGVGIGLYIVRRLAVAQHGTVVARTRPEGGTIMRLTLRTAEDVVTQRLWFVRAALIRSRFSRSGLLALVIGGYGGSSPRGITELTTGPARGGGARRRSQPGTRR